MVKEYANPAARMVLIQPVDHAEMWALEDEINEIKRLSDKDFCLYAPVVDNWNRDLSPWEAPAVFGREAFGGGAEDTLREVLRLCGNGEKEYILGGYSLAALFSVWAAYQTDRFAAVAAASPSVWFPGFLPYMKEHEIKTGALYLSLGDKEEKTRNPVMSTVGDCIREAYGLLSSGGCRCVLEWNRGNHFNEADSRTAKAFAWALNSL